MFHPSRVVLPLEELLRELCDGDDVFWRSTRCHNDVIDVVYVLRNNQGDDVEAVLSAENIDQLVDVKNSAFATCNTRSLLKEFSGQQEIGDCTYARGWNLSAFHLRRPLSKGSPELLFLFPSFHEWWPTPRPRRKLRASPHPCTRQT